MVTRFPGGQEIARKWFLVDAQGQTLGRLATRVASILAGKENPRYTPFIDVGDHVIVVNASKIKLTGLKAESNTSTRALWKSVAYSSAPSPPALIARPL